MADIHRKQSIHKRLSSSLSLPKRYKCSSSTHLWERKKHVPKTDSSIQRCINILFPNPQRPQTTAICFVFFRTHITGQQVKAFKVPNCQRTTRRTQLVRNIFIILTVSRHTPVGFIASKELPMKDLCSAGLWPTTISATEPFRASETRSV